MKTKHDSEATTNVSRELASSVLEAKHKGSDLKKTEELIRTEEPDTEISPVPHEDHQTRSYKSCHKIEIT